eukprot:4061838-Pleurochrysis_carterae.AAC.1
MALVTRKYLVHSIHRPVVKAAPADAAHTQRPQVLRIYATWPLSLIQRDLSSSAPPRALGAQPGRVSQR